MTNKLTARNLEALAMAALHGNPFRQYVEFRGASSNKGGAERRMVDDLKERHLLPRSSANSDYPITVAGLETLLNEIRRVSEFARDDVEAAARKMLPEVKAEEARLAEQVEAAKAERAREAGERALARRGRIAERFGEIAGELGLTVVDEHGDAVGSPPLVDLWEAIVDADNAL